MTLAELPAWAFELLEESRIAHLGLVDDDGFARVLPVTYVVHDGALWTVVDEKPKRRRGAELARVRWLRARPRATVTVDRYDDDWSRLAWCRSWGRSRCSISRPTRRRSRRLPAATSPTAGGARRDRCCGSRRSERSAGERRATVSVARREAGAARARSRRAPAR